MFQLFCFDPVSVHSPKTKYMKHLPQADDKQGEHHICMPPILWAIPCTMHPWTLTHPGQGTLVEDDEFDCVGDEARDVAEEEEHHHQDRRLRVARVSLLKWVRINKYRDRMGFWKGCWVAVFRKSKPPMGELGSKIKTKTSLLSAANGRNDCWACHELVQQTE